MADIILLAKVRSIFSAAANRVNLVSGEDLEVSLGKISKWLSDLKTVAFTGSYNDLTDKPSIPSSAVTGVKGNSESSYRSGNVNITKSNIGLGSVENKSSATIRSEITSSNVTSALGYTPVNKAGDAMTGTLQFKDNNGNVVGDIQGSSDDTLVIHGGETVDGILELDSQLIELLCSLTEVSGELQLDSVYLPSTSDNDECRVLGMVIHSDDMDRTGRVVKLSASDIVTSDRIVSGLGYTPVNKAGDTVTGNVIANGAQFQVKSTNINRDGASPSSAITGNGAIRLIDKDDEGLGTITAQYLTDGNVFVYLQVFNEKSNGTQVSNHIGLLVDKNGKRTYNIADPANFRSAIKTDVFDYAGQSHASVFRGKYLGSSFTSAQKAAIANGTFDDLYVGDYWTINGINWRIADINYFKSVLNTDNHIVIVPDTILYNSRMNTANNTNGGYVGSEMYTTNLQNAITTIESAFGSTYIMSHVALLTNAASNGVPSGWSRYTIKCGIMPSTMLYGGRDTIGSYLDFSSGNSKAELSVFSFDKSLIPDANGGNYWVRDAASAYAYNIINGINCLDAAGASGSQGVRPYFCLKGA